MGFPRILSNNNKVYTKLGEFCLSGDGDHFWIVCHTCQLELQTHTFWEHIQEEHSFTNQDQILADVSIKPEKQTPSTPYQIQDKFCQPKESIITSPQEYDSDEPESLADMSVIDANEVEVKKEPGEEYSYENPIYAQIENVASNSNSMGKRKHDFKDDAQLLNSKRNDKPTSSSSTYMTLLPGNKSDDLKKLLSEWNLEHIYEGLSSCGVTIDRLKFLEKDDIDNIFPGREEVGLRAEIKQRISSWKAKNLTEEIATTVRWNSYLTPTCNSELTSKSLRSAIPFKNDKHVSNILQLSKAGNGLLAYYKENNKLEKENRKVLVNCIIEYYYDSLKNKYYVPKNPQLEKMAEQIIEIFPTESKDVYYISRQTEKANPSGLLYNKFKNVSRNKRKLTANETLQLEHFEAVSQEAVFEPGPENDLVKKKMKSMQNDEEETQTLWLKSYEYRRNNIMQFHKLTEIFEEWPFFKQAGGQKFIDLDFGMLHPQKMYMLINKWAEFQQSLTSYYFKYIKDKQYRLLFEKLCSKNIDKNSKDCISIMLLNAVLKPTSRVTVVSETGTSTKKISVRDAINSCIMHIPSCNDLQRTMEVQLNTYTPRKGTIQPYIIVVGSDINSLTDFYVCIGETPLKFTSFIAAFDICFKAFHVFDLPYPKESQLLWFGIQKYIFDLTTIHDIKSSVLAEFLGTIKNY